MGVDNKDFAREALDGFFRRHVEPGTWYCAPCLTDRLARALPLTAVRAAVVDAFAQPGSLRVKPGGPCAVCHRRRRCIGAPLADQPPP